MAALIAISAAVQEAEAQAARARARAEQQNPSLGHEVAIVPKPEGKYNLQAAMGLKDDPAMYYTLRVRISSLLSIYY